MDTSGLHVLLEANAGAGDSPFFILRPSRAVRRLLDATGTRAELPVVDVDEHVLR
jgi:hypothetical protein